MISISRTLHFDAAHRVLNHESKCKNLHGHRYVLEVFFTSTQLDDLGRVVDFSVIKDLLGNWIDNNFDHNVILHEQDKELGENIATITGQKIFYLPYNPTAENIARYLLDEICPKLFLGQNINFPKIRLYETPNCFAEYQRS